jgi:hypothetical protein
MARCFEGRGLERHGDLMFLGGLVLMVVAACTLAWELGPATMEGHADWGGWPRSGRRTGMLRFFPVNQ